MNVKLTKRKAWELISRIHPRLNIKQEATPPDVAIFTAYTGPEGLEMRKMLKKKPMPSKPVKNGFRHLARNWPISWLISIGRAEPMKKPSLSRLGNGGGATGILGAIPFRR